LEHLEKQLSSDVINLVVMPVISARMPSEELALSSEMEDINVFPPSLASLSATKSPEDRPALLPMVVLISLLFAKPLVVPSLAPLPTATNDLPSLSSLALNPGENCSLLLRRLSALSLPKKKNIFLI